jgi:hypothetical protein
VANTLISGRNHSLAGTKRKLPETSGRKIGIAG